MWKSYQNEEFYHNKWEVPPQNNPKYVSPMNRTKKTLVERKGYTQKNMEVYLQTSPLLFFSYELIEFGRKSLGMQTNPATYEPAGAGQQRISFNNSRIYVVIQGQRNT